MDILTVIGARPQFIKAAPVSSALAAAGLEENLLHTGQHYDPSMSEVFFTELGLAAPRWHLELGGGTHGAMTGAMLAAIESILLEARPRVVLVYGDTNSTLAGALAAAKLHIPVAHVEAGLRSFNRHMPEEINRVLTDHLSRWLFCPSGPAADQLRTEGITAGVEVVGDVMKDGLTAALRTAADQPGRLTRLIGDLKEYALMTLHRAENTDDPGRLAAILRGLAASPRPIVLPLHPRTAKALSRHGLELPPTVRAIPPAGYLDMAALLGGCRLVLTDSGGLQKEACWAGKPCLTLRDETEWTETVDSGWNTLAGADTDRIAAAIARTEPPAHHPDLYGASGASARIAATLARDLPRS